MPGESVRGILRDIDSNLNNLLKELGDDRSTQEVTSHKGYSSHDCTERQSFRAHGKAASSGRDEKGSRRGRTSARRTVAWDERLGDKAEALPFINPNSPSRDREKRIDERIRDSVGGLCILPHLVTDPYKITDAPDPVPAVSRRLPSRRKLPKRRDSVRKENAHAAESAQASARTEKIDAALRARMLSARSHSVPPKEPETLLYSVKNMSGCEIHCFSGIEKGPYLSQHERPRNVTMSGTGRSNYEAIDADYWGIGRAEANKDYVRARSRGVVMGKEPREKGLDIAIEGPSMSRVDAVRRRAPRHDFQRSTTREERMRLDRAPDLSQGSELIYHPQYDLVKPASRKHTFSQTNRSDAFKGKKDTRRDLNINDELTMPKSKSYSIPRSRSAPPTRFVIDVEVEEEVVDILYPSDKLVKPRIKNGVLSQSARFTVEKPAAGAGRRAMSDEEFFDKVLDDIRKLTEPITKKKSAALNLPPQNDDAIRPRCVGGYIAPLEKMDEVAREKAVAQARHRTANKTAQSTARDQAENNPELVRSKIASEQSDVLPSAAGEFKPKPAVSSGKNSTDAELEGLEDEERELAKDPRLLPAGAPPAPTNAIDSESFGAPPKSAKEDGGPTVSFGELVTEKKASHSSSNSSDLGKGTSSAAPRAPVSIGGPKGGMADISPASSSGSSDFGPPAAVKTETRRISVANLDLKELGEAAEKAAKAQQETNGEIGTKSDSDISNGSAEPTQMESDPAPAKVTAPSNGDIAPLAEGDKSDHDEDMKLDIEKVLDGVPLSPLSTSSARSGTKRARNPDELGPGIYNPSFNLVHKKAPGVRWGPPPSSAKRNKAKHAQDEKATGVPGPCDYQYKLDSTRKCAPQYSFRGGKDSKGDSVPGSNVQEYALRLHVRMSYVKKKAPGCVIRGPVEKPIPGGLAKENPDEASEEVARPLYSVNYNLTERRVVGGTINREVELNERDHRRQRLKERAARRRIELYPNYDAVLPRKPAWGYVPPKEIQADTTDPVPPVGAYDPDLTLVRPRTDTQVWDFDKYMQPPQEKEEESKFCAKGKDPGPATYHADSALDSTFAHVPGYSYHDPTHVPDKIFIQEGDRLDLNPDINPTRQNHPNIVIAPLSKTDKETTQDDNRDYNPDDSVMQKRVHTVNISTMLGREDDPKEKEDKKPDVGKYNPRYDITEANVRTTDFSKWEERDKPTELDPRGKEGDRIDVDPRKSLNITKKSIQGYSYQNDSRRFKFEDEEDDQDNVGFYDYDIGSVRPNIPRVNMLRESGRPTHDPEDDGEDHLDLDPKVDYLSTKERHRVVDFSKYRGRNSKLKDKDDDDDPGDVLILEPKRDPTQPKPPSFSFDKRKGRDEGKGKDKSSDDEGDVLDLSPSKKFHSKWKNRIMNINIGKFSGRKEVEPSEEGDIIVLDPQNVKDVIGARRDKCLDFGKQSKTGRGFVEDEDAKDDRPMLDPEADKILRPGKASSGPSVPKTERYKEKVDHEGDVLDIDPRNADSITRPDPSASTSKMDKKTGRDSGKEPSGEGDVLVLDPDKPKPSLPGSDMSKQTSRNPPKAKKKEENAAESMRKREELDKKLEEERALKEQREKEENLRIQEIRRRQEKDKREEKKNKATRKKSTKKAPSRITKTTDGLYPIEEKSEEFSPI